MIFIPRGRHYQCDDFLRNGKDVKQSHHAKLDAGFQILSLLTNSIITSKDSSVAKCYCSQNIKKLEHCTLELSRVSCTLHIHLNKFCYFVFFFRVKKTGQKVNAFLQSKKLRVNKCNSIQK